MGLITFPGSFPSAFPATAERLRKKSAPFWYDPTSGKRGDRISWWLPREDVGAALQWVGGQAQSIASSWGSIYRVVRMQSPDDQGQYAVRAEVEWAGNSFDSDQYSAAILTVDFATPEFDTEGSTPYAEIDTEFSAQGITIPGRYLRAETSGEMLNRDAFKVVGSASYILTAYNCPSLVPAVINTAMNSPVNSAALYLPRFGTIDPGYAILRSYKVGQKYYLGGQASMNVSFHIDIRFGLTWQQTLHRGVADNINHPDGSLLYGTSDLNNLLSGIAVP